MQTKVVKIDKDFPEFEHIKQAVAILNKGGLVAFPTETVYGLGANAKNRRAMNRLFEVKERPKDKPFTLLIPNVYDIDELAVGVLPFAYRLADKFWPGPLTLVLKTKDSQTVGLRMPKDPVAQEVVRSVEFPIACSSANLSGKRPPLSAQEALEDLDGKVELILDGGEVELGTPSTVVDVCELPVKILRPGFIKDKLIEEASLEKRIIFICTGNSCRSVMAKALFEKKLKERGRGDIEVVSAGVSAPLGLRASSETKQLLLEEGLDVSGHGAQRTTGDMLRRCDLVFVMQRFQEEAILKSYGFLKDRVYLLKEFSKFDHNELEVEDPIGKGMDVYKKCFSTIKEAVGRLVDLV